MALTRPKLKEIFSEAGADEEKIAEAVEKVIKGHTTTIDALKEEIKTYKENAEKLPEVEKELNELKEKHKNDGENPFEKKYNDLKAEYEKYKGEVTEKETKRAKKHEYKAILKEAGVNEKRIESVLKVTNLDDVELDENGKIKDRDKLKDTIKTEWADFLVETSVQGAKTATPPANTGGSKKTKEEIFAIKDTVARQKAMAENKELFLK